MLRRLFNILWIFIIVLASAQTGQARTTNDFFITSQKHLSQIDAQGAWDFETGSRDVVIAIIDTGVDINHEDLKDNIWVNVNEIPFDGIDNDDNGYIDDRNGWDFVDGVSDPNPKVKTGYDLGALLHGTIVAGVAGAVGNNEIGVSGVAWEVSLMSLRALDHTGTGDSVHVTAAIEYAVANGADIINLSVVGTDNDTRLQDALQRAYEQNVAVVAAAGNEGDDHQVSDLTQIPHYPVCHDGQFGENYVIGVAGVDELDKKARYSNFGTQCIDISAPGSFITTTQFFQPAITGLQKMYTDGWSGTSLATPIISGSLALLKSARPDISIHSLAEVLTSTAENIDDKNPQYRGELGAGRVSLRAALAAVQQSELPLSSEPPTSTETDKFNPEEVRDTSTSINENKSLSPSSIVFCNSDTLIKSPVSLTVYYCGVDGKRYAFQNQKVFKSWYDDFSTVVTISVTELATIPLGGNVTYRPGISLVKITTDPKVYAVDSGATLRWVANEEIAEELYGVNWRDSVQDIQDSIFIDYRIGKAITTI
jgi:subtilisin family serine protease